MRNVSIRRVVDSDRALLFSWRNDPHIIRLSKTQASVTAAEHDVWFSRIRSSDHTFAFIVEVEHSAAGHIRIDCAEKGRAYISAYLIPGYVGQGYGTAAISQAVIEFCRTHPRTEIIAEVREDNAAGRAVFNKCGFALVPELCGNGFLTLTRRFSAGEAATVDIFDRLSAEHGDSHKALGWGTEASQMLRFKVIASIGELHGASVLDVGCGLGHFADWLEQAGINASYTGLELNPTFAIALRKRRPATDVHVGSILSARSLEGRLFDYVLASGIFFSYVEDPYSVLRAAVSKMWHLSRKGVAFNSLSSWASDQEVQEFYADPLKTLAIAREITPWVTLRHDYHHRDFTIYMRRESSVS